MRIDLRICAAAAALLGLAGMTSPASAQGISGSFQSSCRNIQNFGSALTADCRDTAGHFHTSSIRVDQCRGDIGNNNGNLTCSGGDNRGGDNRGNQGFAASNPVTGSFQRSCRNVQVFMGTMTADCADSSGRYRATSLSYTQCRGDIGNANGALTCSGAGGSGQATGSFQRSCRNIQTMGSTLMADCTDASGRYRSTTLAFTQCKGDIANNNGALTCNGAASNAAASFDNRPSNQQQGPADNGARGGNSGGNGGGGQGRQR